MKSFYALIFVFLLSLFSAVACDTLLIDRSQWELLYVSSEETVGENENNGHAIHAFDNDASTFWHSQWKDSVGEYPYTLIIDLKDTVQLNGISILTRDGSTNGRVANFELYITNDTTDWGVAAIIDVFDYPNPSSGSQQRADYFFGAVAGRFVKLVALNSLRGDTYLMVAELNLYQDSTCVATGQHNQTITFDAIEKQYTHITPLELSASASSGLPITYEVVSGPATISGSMLHFTGGSGEITIAAVQEGDAEYYGQCKYRTFEVINLQHVEPVLLSRLTSDYPLQMPKLYPYLLLAGAYIAEGDYLSVDKVTFQIADTTLVASYINGQYQAWWTPSSYGEHTITTTAIASNGKQAILSHDINVVPTASTQLVKVFDAAVIDWGTIGKQWYRNSYTLPQSVDCYKQIICHFDVSCPNVPGGCDDWDRLAWVEIQLPNGEWLELFRYITSYGVACSHSVDLTDYASLLQGDVEIRAYIETWGSGGWQMDMDFEYVAGKPDYRYSHIQPLWHAMYNFGDPLNLQPIDTVLIEPISGSRRTDIRLVTTGHGWGNNNSNNAAEFYKAMHHLKVNGKEAFEHQPWLVCNPNPDGCSPQYGTWTYARAGWCPGAIGQIHMYDLTSYLSSGPVELSYILQESYIDKCHPSNPDCVSGKTCPDCNDTFNPMYRIGGCAIHKSDQPIGAVQGDYLMPDNGETLEFTVYPVPVDDYLFLVPNCSFNDATLIVLDVSGRTHKTFYFPDERVMGERPIELSNLPDGVYYVKLYTSKKHYVRKIIVSH